MQILCVFPENTNISVLSEGTFAVAAFGGGDGGGGGGSMCVCVRVHVHTHTESACKDSTY